MDSSMSDSYMVQAGDSYMDSSMSDSYMDSSMSDSYMDLNEKFINDTGSNKNEAGQSNNR